MAVLLRSFIFQRPSSVDRHEDLVLKAELLVVCVVGQVMRALKLFLLLDDLRDLVDSMLSTDADRRPSLDEIVAISKKMRKQLSGGGAGNSKQSSSSSSKSGEGKESRK